MKKKREREKKNHTILPCDGLLFAQLHKKQEINKQKKKQTQINRITKQIISHRTGSLTSRGSDESKSRRVFGSLLRRHTSFGAPDNNARAYTTTHSTVSTLSQENHEMK